MGKVLPASTDGWAFFLDIDGTLIDIAPTPDAVVVSPGLPIVLDRLCRQTGGATALLTGRTIETVDRLFAPARLPVGAIHGTRIRFHDGKIVSPPPSAALGGIRRRLADFVAAHAGTLLEDKGAAVAVHYRAKPSLHDAVEAEIHAALATDDADLIVQPGKLVFEIRPGHADKGKALTTFMANPVFAGRRPVAIGDDITDESMFAAAERLGGHALRVGPAERGSAARPEFDSPAALRAWLSSLIRS